MVVAYIGLGANLGDPEKTIGRAVAMLDQLQDVEVVRCSSCYRSPPMMLAPTLRQPDYVNAVVHIDTSLRPMQLLHRLQGVEKRLGRLRTGKRWASRTLDLDLLLYGERRIALPRLTVPHPGIAVRSFVLTPLAEIAPPDLWVPGHGRLAAMQALLPDNTLQLLGECRIDG